MAGVASRLSRKELDLMAEDIEPEMIAVMNPETILKGLNAEKQQALLLQMLTSVNIEEIVNSLSLTQRKRLFDLVLKMLAGDLTGK